MLNSVIVFGDDSGELDISFDVEVGKGSVNAGLLPMTPEVIRVGEEDLTSVGIVDPVSDF